MAKYHDALAHLAIKNAKAAKERSQKAFEEDQKILSYFSVQPGTHQYLINGKVAHPHIIGGLCVVKGSFRSFKQVDHMDHTLMEYRGN